MENKVEEMKKTIVNAGLYIVKPQDLEELAQDTIEQRLEQYYKETIKNDKIEKFY